MYRRGWNENRIEFANESTRGTWPRPRRDECQRPHCLWRTAPLFLDYFACGKLDVEQAHRVIHGIQKACQASGCVLLGGETAEMPGFYQPPKFDIAGFAVGEVHRVALIDGQSVRAGDVMMGLPSTGFHANGYSLVRKIIAEQQLDLKSRPEILQGQSLGEALTHPTALYPRAVQSVLNKVEVKAMAHITGGGLRNIQRVLPKDSHTASIKAPFRVRRLFATSPKLETFLKKKPSLFGTWDSDMFLSSMKKTLQQ